MYAWSTVRPGEEVGREEEEQRPHVLGLEAGRAGRLLYQKEQAGDEPAPRASTPARRRSAGTSNTTPTSESVTPGRQRAEPGDGYPLERLSRRQSLAGSTVVAAPTSIMTAKAKLTRVFLARRASAAGEYCRSHSAAEAGTWLADPRPESIITPRKPTPG